MFENRVTEEAKSVKKACPKLRGYVLQCHLKTTLTHLTTDKHAYTHVQYNLSACLYLIQKVARCIK